MGLSKIFIDSDAVIDVFTAREPFYESSSRVMSLAYDGKIQLLVSTLTYSNVFYMLRKFSNRNTAIEKLSILNAVAATVSVGDKEIKLALNSGFTDFEDAIQYYTALSAHCDYLVTRNIGDYSLAGIPVLTPTEFMKSKIWE